MNRQTPVLIGLAITGATATLITISIFEWMSWTCRLPSSEAGKPLADGPIGCLEFWLNRYQTLIGVLAAIAAAGLAWVGVQKQIDITARQTSASLVSVINDRLAASQRLRTAMTIIDAYESFTFDILGECIDIVDILKTMAEDEDISFDLVLESELRPTVEEYSQYLDKFKDSAVCGREEIKKAIVVGQARIDAEGYFTTADLLISFHYDKLKKLKRLCAAKESNYIHRNKEVNRFYDIISKQFDRIDFRLLPAFESARILPDRLSKILESAVKKSEEGLL